MNHEVLNWFDDRITALAFKFAPKDLSVHTKDNAGTLYDSSVLRGRIRILTSAGIISVSAREVADLNDVA